jgi:SSS family solute:Na+ symporter
MIVWVPCILVGVWGAAYLGGGVNPNTVLGQMVGKLVHSPVLTGLVGAGVLAAIMSSLDSQFLCVGTMFTNDVVVRLFGENRFTDKQRIALARGFILLVVAITYLLALWLKDSAHVFDLGVWCFSGFASLFPLAFAAVYWRRTTAAGAIASTVVMLLTWCILFYRDIIAVKPKGAGGDELLIFGMMPVTWIFAASMITLVLVSLATKAPSPRTIDKFFVR